jgi:predicted hydrocarbon binding protein
LPFEPEQIKDGRYYPYSYIRDIHRKLLEKNQDSMEKAFSLAGKSIAEAALEGRFFVNYIVRKRSLEKTFTDLLKAWESENFRNVFTGSMKREGNKLIITLDQICDDRGEEVCWLNLGGMEGVIKVSGKKAKVRHTECVFHGAEHCVYEIEMQD